MPKNISFSIPTLPEFIDKIKPANSNSKNDAGVVGNEPVLPQSGGPSNVGAGEGGAQKKRLLRLLRKDRNDPQPMAVRSNAGASSDSAQSAKRSSDPGLFSPLKIDAGDAADKAKSYASNASLSATRAAFYRRFNLEQRSVASDALPDSIALTGNDLTVEQVVYIARHGAQVTISEEAMARVRLGFEVVLEAARQGKAVYGLTTGVGQNKDKTVLKGKQEAETEEQKMAALLAQSRAFNLTSIRAHTSGTGGPMRAEEVRAGMLVRLNTLLKGSGGVQPAVVESLRDFLNHGITPLIPDCGSIGEGDLLLMGHIGMLMVGEGWTILADQSGPASSRDELESAGLDPDGEHRHKRIRSAADALAHAGLDPIELVGKDFLSIVSSNALTAGSAMLSAHDASELLLRETVVFSLCLEGLNGNIAPFLKASTEKARPFLEMTIMAKAIRDVLEGSFLWDSNSKLGKERAMQDPLVYRTMAYNFGETLRALGDLRDALHIQMNNSDDNPYVDLDYRPSGEVLSEQERKYVVELNGGRMAAIVPTGNFDSTPFVRPMEHTLDGLGQLSTAMANTTLRFESPDITKLPRFLAAGDGHGFGAVSKGIVGLANGIKAAAEPGRSSNLAVAGGQLEDSSNAGPVTAKKLREVIPLMYSMASYQTMYASQAVDLRGGPGEIGLSPITEKLYAEYRQTVPPMNEDMQTATALRRGEAMLKQWSLANEAGR